MIRNGLSLLAPVLVSLTALTGCRGEEPAKTEAAPIGSFTPGPGSEGLDGQKFNTPGLVAAPAPTLSDSPRAVARRLLAAHLNSTVENTERFEKAPLYRLALDVDWELFTYSGTLTLHLTNLEKDTLSELVFFTYPNSEELAPPGAKNLAIGKVIVDGKAVAVTHRGTRLSVPLAAPLKPGDETTVEMVFRGNIVRLPPGSNDLKQMAMQQLAQMFAGARQIGGYGVFSYADDIVSLALWYPILASYDEDGWDLAEAAEVGDVSYFDVANYELSVTAPSDVKVIASGVETDRREADGRRTTTFAAGAVREVAVQLSTRYESESAFVDGVQVRSWFLNTDRASGQAVLKYGSEALKRFNELFGPYPYCELDLVEAPLVGGAGGVEFPGLVTVGKMFYASDRGASGAGEDDEWRRLVTESRYMKDTLEFVVAHEVAHQWWNAVVGSDSKRHPFVDEALANHSAILYFEKVHGKEAAALQREVQLVLPYQVAMMAGAKDRAVDLPAESFDGALEYAAIVYGKGALWFETMRERFGDRTHIGFLKDYYRRHAFGIARPEDLIDGLVKSAGDPGAARVMADRWLHEAHGHEDVPSIRWARLARYLIGPEALAGGLGRILELLDNEGAAELLKVVGHFLSDDPGELDIDYAALLRLFLDLQGADDGEADILAGLVRMLTENPDGFEGKDLRGVLKGLAKSSLGGDDKTDALIDIADALLKLLAE